MPSSIHRARWLFVIGGVLAVLRLELGWLPPVTVDLVQGVGLVLLLAGGLRVRAATSEAASSTQTGLAVLLLGLAVLLHLAGVQGHASGAAAAPSWAAGVLLSSWAAARSLDLEGDPRAEVWSLAYTAGLLVWTPVAILFGRVVWATTVLGVDGLTVGVAGPAALLVTMLMTAPFLLLLSPGPRPADRTGELLA